MFLRTTINEFYGTQIQRIWAFLHQGASVVLVNVSSATQPNILFNGFQTNVRLDLESLIRLSLLQQVKQMLSLQLQPQLVGYRIELNPLCTQSELLREEMDHMISLNLDKHVFLKMDVCSLLILTLYLSNKTSCRCAVLTFASSIMDSMDSEFVLDSVLSSCHVDQGNGGRKVNIWKKREEKNLIINRKLEIKKTTNLISIQL